MAARSLTCPARRGRGARGENDAGDDLTDDRGLLEVLDMAPSARAARMTTSRARSTWSNVSVLGRRARAEAAARRRAEIAPDEADAEEGHGWRCRSWRHRRRGSSAPPLKLLGVCFSRPHRFRSSSSCSILHRRRPLGRDSPRPCRPALADGESPASARSTPSPAFLVCRLQTSNITIEVRGPLEDGQGAEEHVDD